MQQNLPLEANSHSSSQEILSFMEHEGSLLCSQEPTTGSYPELVEPSLNLSILYLPRSILILSSHLCLGLPIGIFPSEFLTKIFMHFSSFPCVLHALSTPFSLI